MSSDIGYFEQGMRRLWMLCLFGFVFGAVLTLTVSPDWLQPAGHPVNIYLFRLQDTVWLGFGWVVISAMPTIAGRLGSGPLSKFSRLSSLRQPVAVMTLTTLVLSGAGVDLIYHGYALSVDEFLARFQADIFLGGHLLAPLKAEWAEMANALQPFYVHRADGLWGPGYRPLVAAFIALFDLVGLGRYTNVVLAAGCLPLLAALARRIWPTEGRAPALAVFVLASSPQFLIMAMTPYAMTAHLFFSLLWLCFFLRGGVGGHLGAALTGFIAVGLHQVHVHPFFVLPFMLSLLADRRLKLATAYALWYAAVLVFWIFWRDVAIFTIASGDVVHAADGSAFLNRIGKLLLEHAVSDVSYWLANLFRFFAWQNLILLPLLWLALRHWRQAPRPIRLLGWSILASALPYLLFMPTPEHGWGYRYLHPTLGSFALLAVYGWLRLKESLQAGELVRVRRVLLVLSAVSVVIGLPLRALQVERFVAPFAAASAYIAALPNDVVLVDGLDTWFGVDLVRNDPFLERGPKVLETNLLSDDELGRLCRRHRVALIDFEALRRFGMTMMPRSPAARAAARSELRERLRLLGCLPSSGMIHRRDNATAADPRPAIVVVIALSERGGADGTVADSLSHLCRAEPICCRRPTGPRRGAGAAQGPRPHRQACYDGEDRRSSSSQADVLLLASARD